MPDPLSFVPFNRRHSREILLALKPLKTTIVLADDNREMREGAATFLKDRFDIVATVANGAMAVRAADDLQPDIVVLDVAMPVMGGIEAAGEIKRRMPSARIIFLSIQMDHEYIEAAAKIGASYVLKSRMNTDLPTAIDEALAGRNFMSVFQEC